MTSHCCSRALLLSSALLAFPQFSSAQPVTTPQLVEVKKLAPSPQSWVDIASIKRVGPLAEGWVLNVLNQEISFQGKPTSATWTRLSANCETYMVTQTAWTFVETNGKPLAPFPTTAAPPAAKSASRGTHDGNIVEMLCRKGATATPTANSAAQAIAWTRQPALRPAVSAAIAPSSASLPQATLKSCAAQYEALSQIASSRLIDVMFGVLPSTAKPLLEKAKSDYAARAKKILPPTNDYTWLLGTAIGIQKPYTDAKNADNEAGKAGALRSLKASARTCDEQLNLPTIELP